jgi:hypothetical protein
MLQHGSESELVNSTTRTQEKELTLSLVFLDSLVSTLS